MKFGVEIPTCTSGMMHPVPFADAKQVVDTAIEPSSWAITTPGATIT
jgi:hypothetical protein